MWGTGIGLAAGLQFLANIPPTPLALFPDEPMMEYDLSDHPFRDDLICHSIRYEDGVIKIPNGPGLGVEVDREVVNRLLIRS